MIAPESTTSIVVDRRTRLGPVDLLRVRGIEDNREIGSVKMFLANLVENVSSNEELASFPGTVGDRLVLPLPTTYALTLYLLFRRNSSRAVLGNRSEIGEGGGTSLCDKLIRLILRKHHDYRVGQC